MEELLLTKSLINLLKGKALMSFLSFAVFVLACVLVVALTFLFYLVIGIIWNIPHLALKVKQKFRDDN